MIEITEVPDDVDLPSLTVKLSATVVRPGEGYSIAYDSLGQGKIASRRNADLADEIQEACIKQMQAMGLNPNSAALLVDGKVSRTQTIEYLSRRSSMGSHKLQHLLRALKMRVVVK